jgi:Domain of unknown function (DUF4288)
MAYIPADAHWYIAEVILEHIIEDDPRNVVHVNVHLIEATSPDEAYKKAIALGRRNEMAYESTTGGMVRVVFRGLRDLNVIHEVLEDGAEIMYEKHIGVSEQTLRTMAKKRRALSVFAPIEDWATSDDPNLMSDDVGRLLFDHFKGLPDDPT